MLILVSKVMSYLVILADKKKTPAAAPVPAAQAASPAPDAGIPDRSAFVAAVSAAIATVMGADVTGLRIVSIKKAD